MRARISVLLRSEVVRFGAVGLVNTGLDLGIYFVLQAAGMPIVLANLISTTAGLSFSFVANRLFTFSARPSGGFRRQLVLFVACTGVGLWILQPLVIVGVDRLLASVGATGALRILLAKLAGIACGIVWNWLLYSRVVFRLNGAAGGAPSDMERAVDLAPFSAGRA